MAIDLERVVTVAVDALLHDERQSKGNPAPREHRRLRFVGTLALGAAAAVAARKAYERARELDLEQVAGAVEDKLER